MKTIRNILFLCTGLIVIGTDVLAEEFRTLTNNEGDEIEAKVIEYLNDQHVTIELRNGKTYKDVDISRFSIKDRTYFKEWEKARIAAKENADLKSDTELSIFVKSARDDDLNDKGDPDNREVEYEPAITFDNKEKDFSFKNVSGTLVFIGQSVLENSEFHILYREDFKVDLPRGERVHWEGKPFKNVYDDYARNGSAFGAEYEGYLVVLRDKNQDVRVIKASKSSWKDDYRQILKANMRQGHSRDFRKSFPKTVH
jgi:hypothetical protein